MILKAICGLHCSAVRCNFLLLTVLRLSQKEFHGELAHFSPPLKSVCELGVEHCVEATDVKVMGGGALKTDEDFDRVGEAYPHRSAARPGVAQFAQFLRAAALQREFSPGVRHAGRVQSPSHLDVAHSATQRIEP